MVGEEAKRGSMIGIVESDRYQCRYQCENQCISEYSSKQRGAPREKALLGEARGKCPETFKQDITRRGIVTLQTRTIHQVTYRILS